MKKTFSVIFLVFLLATPVLAWAEGANIFKIGEDVTIEKGTRVNSVVAINGQITVSGTVDGNVVVIGNSVVLTKSAVVEGNVVSVGGVIAVGKGADIRGSLTEINSSNISDVVTTLLSDEWEGWSWIWAIFSLIIFFSILIIGILLAALLPGPVHTVGYAMQKETLKVSLWGLLALILIVPLAVLLTISVIGIVLIPLEIILVVCAALMGFIAVAQLIGQKVCTLFKGSRPRIIRETFWGLVIIWLIGWIPYIGWMLKVFILTIGLGAVIYSRFGTTRHDVPEAHATIQQ
ncbi:MAG: hypothetical protein CSYNP_02328 [Syntrophus sp. SKADARSKE-3]|nr:hypothetical protein [Syntrophus sp. SKADARSKE-3]